MRNENSDALNNKECGYSFKNHRQILRNPIIKSATFCTVKVIPLSD
jgi:hypothetical protein